MHAMRSLESRAHAPGGLVASRVSQTRRGAAQLRLHALLDACLAYERCRFIRGELVTLLAASSIGVWITAVRPGLLPSSWRFGFEGFWAMCFLCVVGAALAEWRRRRAWQSITTRADAASIQWPGGPADAGGGAHV